MISVAAMVELDVWKRVISIVVWVVSGVGLVSGYISIVDRPIRLIVFQKETVRIFSASGYVPVNLAVGPRNLGAISLYETSITVWNAGNTAIDRSEVRLPLTVRQEPIENHIETRVVSSVAPIAENFKSENIEGGVKLTWNVFDPGMGFRIAVLHKNSNDVIGISGVLAPGVEVRSYRKVNVLGWITFFSSVLSPTLLLIFTRRESIRIYRHNMLYFVATLIAGSAVGLAVLNGSVPYLSDTKSPLGEFAYKPVDGFYRID